MRRIGRPTSTGTGGGTFLVSLAFTIAAVIGFLLVLVLGVGVPVLLQETGLPPILQMVLVVLGMAAIYRFAPDRDEPKWRWVTWGSIGERGAHVADTVGHRA